MTDPSPPSAAADNTRLAHVQRWLQAVITHPGGVAAGADSDDARSQLNVGHDGLEQVICRSQNLTSLQRLDVYANAYWSRLLECLSEDYPVLRTALGDDLFAEFAFGYLQACPSQSYTLNELGACLADYLEATRPRDEVAHDDSASHDWPQFLVELARLERAIAEVFDGPGAEQLAQLDTAQLQTIDPERWPEARLQVVPCLRLLEFRWPVNAYFTSVRQGNPSPKLEPGEHFLALSRRDYVVRRYELSRPQYRLLEAIVAGQTVGEAIEQAAAVADMPLDALAAALQQWFGYWTAEGLFQRVELE